MEDIRWHQRFSNYKKAVEKLRSAVEESEDGKLTDLEKEGLVQRFEYTFELAWKTLQDLLESKGYNEIKGPNPVLRQAILDGYIQHEKAWRSMKSARDLTSHTYEEKTANDIVEKVKSDYYKLLLELKIRLDQELLKK